MLSVNVETIICSVFDFVTQFAIHYKMVQEIPRPCLKVKESVYYFMVSTSKLSTL